MKRMRPTRLGFVLLAASGVAVACGPSASRGPRPPAAARPGGAVETGAIAAPVAQRPVHKVRTFPERRPQTGITTPMKGEPAPAALAESRLVPSTCEKLSTEETELKVKEMRAAVEESFKEWAAEQPDCWEQMREEYRMRKDAEGTARPKHAPYAPRSLGDALQSASGVLSAGSLGQGAGIGAGGSGTGALKKGGAAPSNEPARARTASGTNNQVASVDEADIVKTDGRWVYLAANGALRIVEAMNPRVVSVTKIGGTTIRDLFVDGDRAVVYTSNGAAQKPCTYGYDCTFAGDGSSTKVTVLDVSNRAQPKVVREMSLSGSLVAARRIGRTIHTVVADNDDSGAPSYETWPEDVETCGTPWGTARARFDKLKAANERAIRSRTSVFPTVQENGKETRLCGLLRTPIRDGAAFTSIVSFDLGDDKTAPTTATLQSRPGAVFASETGLYVSVVHRKPAEALKGRWYSYGTADEVSEIHKFRIGASPKDTRYVGSGTVPGHVLNQFAMDEWHGYLRVATTKGRVPDPKVESLLSILAETEVGTAGARALTRVGAVEKIAPGEDIRAVRFDGDRGYVVTFKKTDPLFVLDLFEPQRPAILGELKIPGFSTYMHRIDPEHLLSIGFDANDHGDFAYFDGVILQLFDVKNPTDPRLVHKEKIGTRGSSSEAATNHLAFNYFASEGLLAVPMTVCEGGGDGRNGDSLAFSGLLVYDVDVERGFTRLGGVDHGTKGASCGTWWSNANSQVKRSVFLDDLVYSIATDRVKVQRMTAFGKDLADLSMQ